ARYSFVGWDPFLVLRAKGDSLTLEEMGETARETGKPLEKLRVLARQFSPATFSDLPPFAGGGVGYFAYDLVRQFERLPSITPDELQLHALHIMYFSTIVS